MAHLKRTSFSGVADGTVLGLWSQPELTLVCLAHALRLNGHKVFREVYLDIEWEGLLVERVWAMYQAIWEFLQKNL